MIEEYAHFSHAEPVNPQLIFHELSKRLPEGRSSPSAPAQPPNWYARDVRLRAGDARHAVGHARDDGAGGALRDRGEVRLPETGR